MKTEFGKWREHWTELANFKGPELLDTKDRIDKLTLLWNQAIPDGWQRENWPENLSGYRRGLGGKKKTPEHEMEKEILEREIKIDSYDSVRVLVNAFPLAKGRTVEADMVAIAQRGAAKGRYW